MSQDGQLEGGDFRRGLSELEKERISEGLRAFALLINDQVGELEAPSSAGSDDARMYMTDEEFWDTYGANLIAFYNYAKYGRWVPEDGLDMYAPGLVDTGNGPEPGFVLVKSARRNPDAR